MSLECLTILMFMTVVWPPRAWCAEHIPPAQVIVEWNRPIGVLNTAATLLVVPSPILHEPSPVRTSAFAALQQLHAPNPRYLAWYPYPHLAVAELEPPTPGRTSWNFAGIDSELVPFLKATEAYHPVVSLATIPAWMFKTDKAVGYPKDVDRADFAYGFRGTELRDPSAEQLAAYEARVFSWYTQGGFTDEWGEYHRSGYHFDIPWWGVLNEPEAEHFTSPEHYVQRYDAIVSAIHKVDSKVKFLALSLCCWNEGPEYLEYFLDAAHHRPGTPVDMIGYHFYANLPPGRPIGEWQSIAFEKADDFIAHVRYLEAIRKRLSPATKVDVDELGLDVDQDGDRPPVRAPDVYWNLGAAYDSYLFLWLARLSIDILTASHFMGSDGFSPMQSMMNWRTGRPNARYRARALLNRHFGAGDRWVATRYVDPHLRQTLRELELRDLPHLFPEVFQPKDLAVQAMTTNAGRRILLINKTANAVDVDLQGAGRTIWAEMIDERSGDVPARREELKGSVLHLRRFAVAVVVIAG